jgi:hypothetical protein
MEVSGDGLSAREQRVLHSIEGGLAASYPRLASRLAVCTRLTAGEAIPAREKIRAHRFRRGAHWPLVWPLLWLVTSVALISVGLAVSHGGQGNVRRAGLIVRATRSGTSHGRSRTW